MASKGSYYTLLGIAPDASQTDVEHSHKKLINELRGRIASGNAPSQKEFDDLDAAFTTLRDPQQRSIYDKSEQTVTAFNRTCSDTTTPEDFRKSSVTGVVGNIILTLSYLLLFVDLVLFGISWFQPSFLSVVTIWAAMCIAPFIVIGHFLTSIGRRSVSIDETSHAPNTPSSALTVAGWLLQANSGLLLITLMSLMGLGLSNDNLYMLLVIPGVIGILGLVVGLKLRKRVAWSKPTAAILSFLNFTNFPIGLVLSCLTLYFLAKGWHTKSR